MSLAKRLNDLAAAHSQNLISDDDYRLLRQELFERYSAEPQQAPKTPRPPQVQVQTSQQSPPTTSPRLRRKGSVVSGVANLFRRATGRSTKKQSQSPPPPPSLQVPLPKRILRKPSLLSLIRPDSAPPPSQQVQSPISPTQDDDPAALRLQITSIEAEHSRLLEAFVSLESSTLKRIQYKTARRLYTPTPTNVSVVMQGREWRRHTKPVPSIILPPLSHHASQPLSKVVLHHPSDQLSIHSTTSSSKLSFPQPHSPLSPRLPTHILQRHDSVSSASTQSTHASSRLALSTAPRSLGNIHLTSLAERSTSPADIRVVVEEEDVDLENDDPEAADYESAIRELDDIRRRREELNIRFATKLEFLKARLKAAELHERVMRR